MVKAKSEILSIAEVVAKEKNIDQEQIVAAMEVAIQKASRAKYGHDKDIRATIDRKTGSISMSAYREVVEDVEDESTQISLQDAEYIKEKIGVGEYIVDELPPFDFGRVAAQIAKQVIFQQVRDAERAKQYEEFKDKVGEIVSGTVKRIEYNNIIVDLGTSEAIIMKDQTIPREVMRAGERVRTYVEDVRREVRGSQIFLSRTHPQFLAKLFTQEVPEIYDGQIEIKGVARDPGSRAKFAVYVGDKSVDPVGICVGLRGSRVQAVVSELHGEKIDIVPWSDNPALFIVNALVPAEVTKVVLDEDINRVEVIVPDDQLSLAIGRGGQNVKLASMLTGWNLDIVSESQESEKRNAELKTISKVFIEALDIDEVIAHLLINEGFKRVEEISAVPLDDILVIDGFEADLAEELQNRAKSYVAEQEKKNTRMLSELKVEEKLIEMGILSTEDLLVLADKGVKTLGDIADLSTDELLDIHPSLSRDVAGDVIMQARDICFKDEK